ncbi:TolB-like protein [Desulfomicrobium macestii]|uniref:TolB-like protein n=1 Tax=Desulfomicrobium macestii TaxID=90731 RepID=A0ABR9H1P3_9BACT|nr:FlgO family outer membrane protein [Desulfomicrobium macestii]MBE1424625.1 TolB-like protein [Desulfomicrobium macestii]
MSKLYVLLFCVFIGGCVQLPPFYEVGSRTRTPPLIPLSYKAGDHLHRQLSGSGVAGYPMLAASFVDSTNVENTNDLGRLLSEQVSSRLSQLGYSVTEVQLRSDELRVLPEGGVLALSRDLSRINTDVPAYSVLVGTYTVIERQIYVNARVLRTGDGVALASSDFTLPYVRPKKNDGGGSAARPSVKTSLD